MFLQRVGSVGRRGRRQPGPFRVVAFAGTRPEAIKFAPILIKARDRPGIDISLVATGQQTDLFQDAASDFSIGPNAVLNVRLTDLPLSEQRAAIEHAACTYLIAHCPDLVLVQGDTTSAVSAARAAHATSIPIGHVEAGLRTHDRQRPYPEEIHRVEIATLADLHFAPSPAAVHNLRAEGIRSGIYVTGNPGIDALMLVKELLPQPGETFDIVATCHRRENYGDSLSDIASALKRLARGGARILYVEHSNPLVAAPLRTALAGVDNICVTAPLRQRELISQINACRLVLTDSGGLQEECAALGVPIVLMRGETERPEVVTHGNCVLTGSDPERIFVQCQRIIDEPAYSRSMSIPAFPYGKGDAADHILRAIDDWRCERARRRPWRQRLFGTHWSRSPA